MPADRHENALSFIAYLEAKLRQSPPKLKGERTRERLKIATARTLEKRGYHAMRVADVSECAGMAEGSFYIYFRDKTDAAVTVLTELLGDFYSLHVKPEPGIAAFEAIKAANARWIAICRANSGLMRCILQLGDEVPEFAHLSQRSNRLWTERVARSASRRRSGPKFETARLAAYMLSGMMDELVRKLVIYPDPEFLALLDTLGADDTALADAASIVWYRVFHPDAPCPANLTSAGTALADWMIPRGVPLRSVKAG